jgi:hypothetical protein
LRQDEFGEAFDCEFGAGFWLSDRRLSGKRIDVLRGQNIPHNAKVIDRTIGANCVVSHKSTDLRLKSYRSPRAVYRLGMHFVRQLCAYRGEVRCDHRLKATFNLHWGVEDPSARRFLEWFVPQTGISAEQEDALAQVIEEASKLDVRVVIIRIPD